MGADDRQLASFDFETHRFRAGLQAPPIVCASSAKFVNSTIEGDLLWPSVAAIDRLEQFLLDPRLIIAFANGSYDLAVAASQKPQLLSIIFRALRDGRVHDILIAQSLDQIFYGTLGVDPRTGGDLRSPTTGKVTKRYSLEIVHQFLTGKVDAKHNDTWRKSYALLANIDPSRWPDEARQYPIDDACNTLEDAAVQIYGQQMPHAWVVQPAIPGILAERTVCKHCSGELTYSWPVGNDGCSKVPRESHKNLDDLPAQVRAAFAAWLGACHSFRTDPQKVAELEADVEAKNVKFVERFKNKGWIRGEGVQGKEEGTEDGAAVKRAVAKAYGVSGTCRRCNGSGFVPSIRQVPCRGVKEKGRYKAGCLGSQCIVCHGALVLSKSGGMIICKNVFDDGALASGAQEALVEAGCDGTGLDLETAPLLPRSDTLGVKTNRDTLTESGDDDLADYGADEFKKSLNTYIPYLKRGILSPLSYSPNVLVATGRYSYEESPLHQMRRNGKERECLRARGAWCGYPTEMVLGSTDYEAGELDTLAQYCYWLFGYSQMKDIINQSGSPGILHSDLAAEVLGLPLDEFLKRLKAKDKQCVDFRQASKPNSFGTPGGMGVPKLVMTARMKNSGFTVAEGGPAYNDENKESQREGYWGIRFCILIGGATRCGVEKITRWKKRECAPVCKACCEIVENIMRPAYFKRYPEVRDYFKWVSARIDKREPALSLAWDPDVGRPRIVRERGGCDYSAYCNNGFQSMLADVIKDAYVTMTEECYLGVKADGSPSPLAGSRVPLVIHDEPLSELILETAHLSGPRIAEIMIASGKKIAPDVVWKAETALAIHWSKKMEPVYLDGKLIPWISKAS